MVNPTNHVLTTQFSDFGTVNGFGSGGGGSQTPWTSDINGAQHSLTNVNNATFTGATTVSNLDIGGNISGPSFATPTNAPIVGGRLCSDGTSIYWQVVSSTYSTNVTFTGSTSMTVAFTPAQVNTNYVVGAPNDLIGVTVTARTTNTFTLSYTSATLTGAQIEGSVTHKAP